MFCQCVVAAAAAAGSCCQWKPQLVHEFDRDKEAARSVHLIAAKNRFSLDIFSVFFTM